MGIYFIAAGPGGSPPSKNREKSLDKSFSVSEVAVFLPPGSARRLKQHFGESDQVYAWAANDEGDLDKLSSGDFVVDVKKKEVVQVFRFAFWLQTEDEDTRLQEYIGWDREKPRGDRRPFPFVYFLKSPQPTHRHEKVFFQQAFDLEENPQWLVRQTWFSDSDVRRAMKHVNVSSVEAFLGIGETALESSRSMLEPESAVTDTVISEPPSTEDRTIELPYEPVVIEPPEWLRPVVSQVQILKEDTGHQERDHEDIVASLFETLGYGRLSDIKFRRGRIDVLISVNGRPIFTIEVKADWSLSSKSKGYIQQAYNYALETGTPFVIITNSDTYVWFKRGAAGTYKDDFQGEVRLTQLTADGLKMIESWRKERMIERL